MTASLPQDFWTFGIPAAAPAPAISEMGHDGQRWVCASRNVDDARHACHCHFVEDVVRGIDGGEDDPVREKAARNVVEVCPAGAELVAFYPEILGKTVVDFTDGIASWMLGAFIEPVPIAHDLVPGIFGHAEVSWTFHVREPYVLKVFVSESHRVEPNVEVEEENAVYFGSAVVSRGVEDQLHGVPESLISSEGLLEGVVGEI